MFKLYDKYKEKIMIGAWIILAAILIPNFIPTIEINPAFQEYHDDYMNMVKARCNEDQYEQPVRLFMDFDDLGDSVIGYCEVRIFSYYIKIDRRFWAESDEVEREQLIFHEMAHCIIDKDHVNDVSNYMFFSTLPRDRQTIRHQVIRDIEDHCRD